MSNAEIAGWLLSAIALGIAAVTLATAHKLKAIGSPAWVARQERLRLAAERAEKPAR
jgi:hypothetical protein